MKYLFVFLLVLMVGCGEAPPIEKNNSDATKTTDTIQEEVSVATGSQTLTSEKTYRSHKCGKFEVMQDNRLKRRMTWDEAKEFSLNLDGGWRVASATEMRDLKKYLREECGCWVGQGNMWASSEWGERVGHQWSPGTKSAVGAIYMYKDSTRKITQPKYTVLFVRDI
ncbi:hypothetical protein N8927_05870 [Crocinitomicaceae bacterium]|nr:hypothetical protein [Crocinitomicaceae bacterium]